MIALCLFIAASFASPAWRSTRYSRLGLHPKNTTRNDGRSDGYAYLSASECLQGDGTSNPEACIKDKIQPQCSAVTEKYQSECQTYLTQLADKCLAGIKDGNYDDCYDLSYYTPDYYYSEKTDCEHLNEMRTALGSQYSQFIDLEAQYCSCIKASDTYTKVVECATKMDFQGCITYPLLEDKSHSTRRDNDGEGGEDDALSVVPLLICLKGSHTLSGLTLDGNKHDGINTRGTNLLITGCTIQNFEDHPIESEGAEDGTVGLLAVSQSVFKDITSTFAIRVDNKATIVYTRFENCYCAINLERVAESSIGNCNFTQCSNTASRSNEKNAIITVDTNAKVTITHCIFTDTTYSTAPACIYALLSKEEEEDKKATANAETASWLVLSNLAFKNTQPVSGTDAAEGGVEVSVEAEDTTAKLDELVSVSEIYTTAAADTAVTVGGVKVEENVAQADAAKIEDESGAKKDAGIDVPIPSTGNNNDDDGFPGWAVALIVVFAVLIIAAVVVVVIVMVRKRGSGESKEDQNEKEMAEEDAAMSSA